MHRKRTFLMLLVALLALPIGASAQEELTVFAGTATNSYVPYYGFDGDYTQHNQIIYPGDSLGDIANSIISSMTFYFSSAPAENWQATFTIRLATTEATEMPTSGYVDITDAEVVYTGTMTFENNTMSCVFDDDFTYTDGNLLVDIQTTASNWKSASFYGVATTGYMSLNQYGTSSPTRRQFIPKTTFTYEPASGDICRKVKGLSADPDITSITINWVDSLNPAGTTYTVQLISGTDTTTLDSNITALTYTATGLESNTPYIFRVKASCSATSESGWATISTRTLCDAITLPFHDGFESYATGTGNFPPCWTKVQSTLSTSYPYVDVYGIEWNNNLYWTASSGDTVIIRTSVLPIEANNMYISFWGASNGSLEVGIMTDPTDTSTFVSFDAINTVSGGSTYWMQFDYYTDTIDAIDAAASEVYLAFRQIGSGQCWLDDVNVTTIGSCRRPTDSDIDSVTYNSALLTWVADGASETVNYDVCYSTYSDMSDTASTQVIVENITDTAYTITDLAPNTHYYAWVRANCGATQSNWHRIGGFTTDRSCYPVTNLAVGNVNYTSALVSWTYAGNGRGLEETGVHMTLRDSNSVVREWDVTVEEGTEIFVTDLNPATSYTLTVRTSCDPDTATNAVVAFSTTACGEVAQGGTTSSSVPFAGNYKWGYSQTLYPATAVAGLNAINGLQYKLSSTPSSYKKRPIQVWIGETNMTSFTTSSYVDTNDMTKVFNDSIDLNNTGWTTINFNQPYTVTHSGANIVVAVLNTTGQYSSFSWVAHTGGVAVYGYQDGNQPASPTTITSYSTKNTTTTVPDIRFVGDCDITCVGPNLLIADVAMNSVDLRWAHGLNETSWAVQYRLDSVATWTDAPAPADTLTTVSGLNAKSHYVFRVGALCGNDTAWSNTVDEWTDCEPLVELPFTDGFEESPTGRDPLCWTVRDFRTSTSSSHGVNTTHHNGNKSMRVYPYGVTYVISPKLPEGTDPAELEINYWANLSNSGQRYEVGFMTDPTDTNTFRVLYTSEGNGGTWTDYTVYGDTTTLTSADEIYVAWRYFVSNGYNCYLDDVNIKVATCKRPTNVHVDSLTHESIAVSWTGMEGANYEYCITRATTAAAIDTAFKYEGEETEFTFTELTPDKDYYVWVRSICNETDTTSWSTLLKVHTPCAPEAMPWAENFNSMSTFSNCWTRYSGNWTTTPNYQPTTSGWAIQTTSYGNINIDGKALGFNLYSTNKYWVVTPSIAITSAAVFTIDMAGETWYSDGIYFDADDRVVIAVSTDGGNNYTPVYQLGALATDDMPLTALTDDYTTITVPLIGYDGQTIRIAVYGGSQASGGDSRILIDNFMVQSADCMRPMNVQVARDAEEATLSWTDISTNNEEGYVLVVNTVNNMTSNTARTFEIEREDSTFTIDSLLPKTTYYYFLRSACGDIVTASSWATGSFRTTCLPLVLPLEEDFQSYSTGSGNFPECWEKVRENSYNQAPYVSTYNSSKALYLYGYNYSMSSSATDSFVIATPYIPAPLNYLEISADFYESSSYAPVKMYVGTDPYNSATWEYVMNLPQTGSMVNLNMTTDTIVTMADSGYVILVGTVKTSGYTYAYLDNVYITEMNPCRRPATVTVDSASITPYTATLSWDEVAGAAGYRVKYNTDNNILTADSIADVTTNEATITGLTNGTHYYAWVQTLCADGISDPRATDFETEISCYPIDNLHLTGSSKTGAAFMWDIDPRGNEAESVIVSLMDAETDSLLADFTSTEGIDYHFFSGLQGGRLYKATFQTVCTVDSSTTVSINFGTKPDACATLEGTGAGMTNLPFHSNWKYGYSQMIYTGSELNGVDSIYGIAFNVKTVPTSYLTRTIDVYMAKTNRTSVSTSDFMPVDSLTAVVSDFGMDVSQTGWVSINFSTPFAYNDTCNLMIAVQNKTGEWSSFNFFCHTAASGRTALWYSDSYECDASDPNSGSPSKYDTLSRQPDIMFFGNCATSTCEVPVIAVTDIDSVSANVVWMGEGDDYTVQYRLASDTVWTSDPATTAPAYISALQPGTRYTVRLMSTCEDSSYISSEVSFYTACAPMHIPFHFTQEDMVAVQTPGFSPCWTWNPNAPFYRSTTNGVAYVRCSNANAWFALPEIAEPLSGAQLRTTVAATSANTQMRVGVMENTGTITWVDTINVPQSSSASVGTEQIIYLDSYTGTGNRVVVGGMGSNNVYFHDFHVEALDACKVVRNLTASNISETEATISWDEIGEASQWLIYRNNTVVATADTTVYTLTGLTGTTEYTLGVRALCSATDTARMVSVAIRTTAHAYSLPYSTGFEVTDDTTGWVFDNDDNGWFMGSATNHGGSRALYISDDQGTSNSYSSGSSDSYAYRLFGAAAGEYIVGFDWRAQGESTYDYLRVFLVPGNVDPTTASIGTSSTPTGWIALDGGSKLNLDSTWTSVSDTLTLAAGNYYLLFFWHNDGTVFHLPPAAIDNVVFRSSAAPAECHAPTGLTLVEQQGTTATISWTAGGNETSWEIMVDNNQPYYTSTTTTYTIDDLDYSVQHTVRVRAVCEDGNHSGWSAALIIYPVGIADVEDALSINLYPNPASSMVRVDANEAVTLTVIDQSGRVVYRADREAEQHMVDVSQMAKGAYYVRLTGQNGIAVRKLVVK